MSVYSETSKSIRTLASSPSNLFEIYTLNIIMSFDYYVLSFLIPLYYSTEYNYSDKKAGLVFGSLGLIIGLFAILGGSIIPWIGCKRGIVLSACLTFGGYLALSMCRSPKVSLMSILALICPGISLAWPVLSIGIKRYSDDQSRSTSNSIMMMGNYLAGIVAGTYIDVVWTYFQDKALVFDVIFSTAAAASGLGLLIALTLKSNDKLEGGNNINITNVLGSKKFWKFLTVICFITCLHCICYEQLDATFPKFLIRVVGKQAHFGSLLGIHSAIMMIGALAFTPLTFRVSSYVLILIGGCLGALACFMLVLGSTNLNFFAFVILLSSGESILVPRTLDYTMKVADNGEEGLYLALCNSPFYFGMVLTGVFSGQVLEMYCPEGNNTNCFIIWKIVTICTIGIVAAMAVLKFCISHKEKDIRDENNGVN